MSRFHHFKAILGALDSAHRATIAKMIGRRCQGAPAKNDDDPDMQEDEDERIISKVKNITNCNIRKKES